jgi:hypothetical protein
MNYRAFLISLFVLLAVHLTAQGQLSFEKTYGGIDDDFGIQARPGANNKYIVAGMTTDYTTGDFAIYLLCVDQNGDTIWTRTINHPNQDDIGQVAIPAYDGSYVFAANYYGNPYTNGLLKFTSTGDSVWTYQNSGLLNNYSTVAAVQSPDSGYVMTGYSVPSKKNPLFSSHMFIQKNDASGNYMWQKDYITTGFDYGLGIDNTPDGGFIICGIKDPPGEDKDAFLMKTNSAGVKEWEKLYRITAGLTMAQCVRSVPSGGYVFCGTRYVEVDIGDVEIVKTDENGNVEWLKTYGGSLRDRGVAVDCVAGGGYIILGETESFGHGNGDFDLYLIRTDENGDTLWTKTFGGPFQEGGGSVYQTPDGGFLVCGYTRSFGSGGADVYLIKTNENGVVTSMPDVDIRERKLAIRPNPARGIVSITSSVPVSSYQITDIRGREMTKGEALEAHIPVTIDISNYSEGLYLFRFCTETGIFCEKMLKIK